MGPGSNQRLFFADGCVDHVHHACRAGKRCRRCMQAGQHGPERWLRCCTEDELPVVEPILPSILHELHRHYHGELLLDSGMGFLLCLPDPFRQYPRAYLTSVRASLYPQTLLCEISLWTTCTFFWLLLVWCSCRCTSWPVELAQTVKCMT